MERNYVFIKDVRFSKIFISVCLLERNKGKIVYLVSLIEFFIIEINFLFEKIIIIILYILG